LASNRNIRCSDFRDPSNLDPSPDSAAFSESDSDSAFSTLDGGCSWVGFWGKF
jgi:hypothetical protein